MATVGDVVGELREDIPLKTGTKSSQLCSCDEDFFGGSRFISFAFAVLSLVITVALLVQIYYGDYQVTPHGSVATDSRECSAIGTSVLKDGGNAADAAIASAFCMAVVNPHTTGLDASGQVLIYSHRTRTTPTAIDFRSNSSDTDLLPRLVVGLAHVHKNYGKLPWKMLVQPSANLARNGFLVPHTLEIRNFKTGNLFGSLQAGQKLVLEALGKTLEDIADIPEEELYRHISAQTQPQESQTLASKFKHYNIYVPRTSAIGLPLLLNLQHIDNVNFTISNTTKSDYIRKIAEITKITYNGLNVTSKFYQGTCSNIGVMDLNDLYISMVTGMFAPFGTQNLTKNGYFMDIKSSPLPTSRTPFIITDGDFICGRRIILGVNDIATASQVISSLLVANENATSSIEAPRFNILDDGTIGIEDAHTPIFTDNDRRSLESIGKVVLINEPYNSCNIVEKSGDNLNSHSDSRGGGIASRF